MSSGLPTIRKIELSSRDGYSVLTIHELDKMDPVLELKIRLEVRPETFLAISRDLISWLRTTQNSNSVGSIDLERAYDKTF